MLRAVFMFIVPGADPQRQRAVVQAEVAEVLTVAVCSYEQAATVATALADEGYAAIELCGGFGHAGVAQVAAAVQGRAAVGVVRFDHHPLLGHRSGDQLAPASGL
ncbi:DUF6506 family protein [Chitinilyticum litopenaei]|uniref:DUF6506 family protein n=1 Tax=Chitinilyticum litopenaei TaxID=1121276 RepID=UPI00041568B2|nr:DUF6506 family protein [Chitinilyticum litopenaei]